MAEPVINHPALGGIRLVFGGNVFGWTIDRNQSFRVLDAFYEAGGRMVDTADGYSSWIPGNKGGESETIIGEWMESRGVRSDMRIATKTGMGGTPGSLHPDVLAAAFAASQERLRTDYVDLYYAHRDDPQTPLDEVASGFDVLVKAGKARELGASNFTPARLVEALDTAARIGAARYTVLQPIYNLVSRGEYEGELQDICVARGIAVTPFYGLASGFLTGKFKSAADWAGSTRAFAINGFAANGGWDVLAAVAEIARENSATCAQVALAWINAQPGIAAPLASVTTVEQLAELVKLVELSPEQLTRLSAV